MYGYNLIGDGIRTHKELRETEILEPDPDDKEEGKKSISVQRRQSVLNKVTKVYWMMACTGFIGFCITVYSLRFFKQNPIGNSVFLNKAIDILKTQELVRQEIGLPLQYMDCIKGYLNYNSKKGAAKCFIYGPAGWGKLKIEGNLDSKTKAWNYSMINLEKDGKVYKIK